MIFDEKILRKLEQLTLVATRVRAGAMKGDRRSSKRGSSIEFADYRNYTVGDDLRQLDWNVYARLERPFIKLLEEEEDLAVHLLVDASESMAWDGGGTESKLIYALRLAGALGHISLSTGDRVTMTLLNSQSNQRWGPHRGVHNSLRLLQFLEAGQSAGITDLNLSLRDYALRGKRPGLLFLLSDLFSPNGYQTGIATLQGRGYEVGIIHLLTADELDPPMAGDVKLVDVETGEEAEITLDAGMINLYRKRLQEWQEEIASYCAQRTIHYIPVPTSTPWDKLVMQTMRHKGVVK